MNVTIAITCYNYGRFLGEAIDSALAQTQPAHEILVVDDGSDDDSVAVAKGYGDRIRLVARPHQGLISVRNFVLQHATGEALVFLDADDRLHPDHLLKTIRAWEEAPSPKPAFVYHQRAILDNPAQVSSFPDFNPAALKQKNHVLVSSLFLLPVAQTIGYDPAFDEGLEDYDFVLGLLEAGHHGRLVDEPLLFVRTHAHTRSLACGQANVRSRLLFRLLRKHRGLYSQEEEAQFRNNIREYVLRKLSASPPQTLRERLQAFSLLLRHRAHPLRFFQLLHAGSGRSATP